jgi:single-stranded-DNA-specific exonuclease
MDARRFLDVSHSFTGRAWVDPLSADDRRIAAALAEDAGVPDIVGRVLVQRGVEPGETAAFLDPKLRDLLPDPRRFAGMAQVAERLRVAIAAQEKIALFGDYDVDGACSVALMARFLRHFRLDPIIHIPDRIFEGYGPNSVAAEQFAADGVTLMITLDCGTVSFDVIAEAATRGLETVVIDHHLADVSLPEAVGIVNPNRQDDSSGQGHLCAAGVTFIVLVEVLRLMRQQPDAARSDLPDLRQSLDLVALATVADVVPLTGVNRAFVRQGLSVLDSGVNAGLAALRQVARVHGAATPYHLGFLLGPRINAGGRIGDAGLGARLLLTGDQTEAERIAAELDGLNKARQEMESVTLEDARAQADRQLEADPAVLIVQGEDWHPGLVGLVASRLKEQHNRPALAITFDQAGEHDLGTGSGRSVPGCDLGAAIRHCVADGLVVKGGGHAMAAGLTVARGNLDQVRDVLSERFAPVLNDPNRTQDRKIDAGVSAGGADVELIHALAQAGPFGSGAPEPVFALPAHRLVSLNATPQGHLRCVFQAADGARIDGILFRGQGTELGDALAQHVGQTIHVAGRLSIDSWGGREKVQIQIVDAAGRPEARR